MKFGIPFITSSQELDCQIDDAVEVQQLLHLQEPATSVLCFQSQRLIVFN